MPITIENISPERDQSEPHDYRLSINGEEIATFKHYRDLGLADCLSLAAEAVRRAALGNGGGDA
jgi:hypothetical protein